MTELRTYEVAFQRIILFRTRVEAATHRKAVALLQRDLEARAVPADRLEAIETENYDFNAEEVCS